MNELHYLRINGTISRETAYRPGHGFAIGYVWYVKLNGTIEFYTAEGYHPVRRELRLLPITLYMINKHIRSSGQSE